MPVSPAPDAAAPPGMCPGALIKGGGAGSGGGDGDGSGTGDGSGGNGNGNGDKTGRGCSGDRPAGYHGGDVHTDDTYRRIADQLETAEARGGRPAVRAQMRRIARRMEQGTW